MCYLKFVCNIKPILENQYKIHLLKTNNNTYLFIIIYLNFFMYNFNFSIFCVSRAIVNSNQCVLNTLILSYVYFWAKHLKCDFLNIIFFVLVEVITKYKFLQNKLNAADHIKYITTHSAYLSYSLFGKFIKINPPSQRL